MSHSPPLLAISFSLSHRRPKDTRENILATKQFTVNIISEPMIEAANATSTESPAEINEWDVSGLTPSPSVSSPRSSMSQELIDACDLCRKRYVCLG